MGMKHLSSSPTWSSYLYSRLRLPSSPISGVRSWYGKRLSKWLMQFSRARFLSSLPLSQCRMVQSVIASAGVVEVVAVTVRSMAWIRSDVDEQYGLTVLKTDIARPPVSEKRFSLTMQGKVRYEPKKLRLIE